jgi:hypothetical protein
MTTNKNASAKDGSSERFYEQTWDLQYKHALGRTVSRFLDGLAEGKIWGRRTTDGRVLVPARSYDDLTHEETGEWVEVANNGVIEMSTVVYEAFNGLPKPPYALAYVMLEGADTALVGYVKGLDLSVQSVAIEAVKIGSRVHVCFAKTPTGTAADYWFELDATS